MKIVAHGHTDVGKARGHNEDTFLVRNDLGLYLVADGMGGHAAGEVASRKAAEVVERYIEKRRHVVDNFDDTASGRDDIVDLVTDAVQEATAQVYDLATSDEGRAGMGTTLTFVLVIGRKGIMGHVGDSRLYLIRQGTVHKLSEDHSYVEQLVKRGLMTEEAAQNSPYANVITRAIGIHPQVEVDTLVFDLLDDDELLLCSDGLNKHVPHDDELAELMKDKDPEASTRNLCDTAVERGGSDNVTTIVVRCEGEGENAVDAGRSTEVNLRVQTLKFIPLFRYLSMRELLAVMEVLRVEQWGAGETVIREGESSDSLYVVMDGRLNVTKQGKELAVLSQGAHFGEMALLNKRPRSATVTTSSSSKLLVMDREAFSELVRREPGLGVKLLWTFSQVLSLRLEESNEAELAAIADSAPTQEIVLPFHLKKPSSKG
jgi:serine/threonine protein phosphatase PrpC